MKTYLSRKRRSLFIFTLLVSMAFAVYFGAHANAAGETSKTISILIINDSYLEGPETFSVNLSNASTMALR